MMDDAEQTKTVPRRRGRPPKRDGAGSKSEIPHTRLTLTVKNALSVLWAFSRETPVWGVNELARELNLDKSMVSRLLATLEERGLVEQDAATEKFQLGTGILELAGVLLGQLDLRQAASDHLRQLAEATGETVNLAILNDASAVLIDQIPSSDPVRYVGWIGEREPLHCSSPGKVFLAYGDPDLLKRTIAEGLKHFTDSTITDPSALQADLDATRRRGYATNQAEYVDSANGVAAPIWRYPHLLAGTVSIAGPAYRLTPDRLAELGEQVRWTANEISRAMGNHPDETA